LNYSKEIPYAVEIVTEEFFEDENINRIRSLIMVERETQKELSDIGAALKSRDSTCRFREILESKSTSSYM
jgi:GTP-binding protein Era